ncbi:MAG: thioredoxin [Atribacterota bacterium]
MANVMEIDGRNFDDEVLKSEVPVLVDFWASWCMPCKMMAPIVEEIAQSFTETVKVVKINTDHVPEVASRYGIHAIPTLIIFHQGKEVGRIVGYVPKKTIEDKLRPLIQ